MVIVLLCGVVVSSFIYFHSKNQKQKAENERIHQQLSDERAKFLSQIAQLEKAREESEDKHLRELNAIKTQLDRAINDNKNLQEQNKQLVFQVENFTKIDTDSQQLNEPDNHEEENLLINRLVEAGTEKKEQEKLQGLALKDTQTKILDDEQETALYVMENTQRNLFITGKAGTGKSFLLNSFFRTTKKKVLKIAPTGIAALNIEGATIHSTFGFYNLEKLPINEISRNSIQLNSEKKLILQSVDTIIIDEISMVRPDILDKIELILRIVNNSKHLFGGKQIILFGDLFQLPPVAKKAEKEYLFHEYGGVFFFFSRAYKSGNFQFVELTRNHRQKEDQSYFRLLNRIREGNPNPEDIAAINSRLSTNRSELRRVLTLFPTKTAAEKMNREELERIPGNEYVYHATVEDSAMQTHGASSIEAQFPISQELRLKVGALVMMVANDPNKQWVNGTMGIISHLEDSRVDVTINGIVYNVPLFKFTAQEAALQDGMIIYRDVLSVWQYPVVLAYAITIHKSQGMTYKRVACDISKCFAPGQAYVALSRCSSLGGLYVTTPITAKSVQVDSMVRDFYAYQKSRPSLFAIQEVGVKS